MRPGMGAMVHPRLGGSGPNVYCVLCAGKVVRRRWPSLTDEGKTRAEIEREEREIREFIETVRDNRIRIGKED